ncbi:MAG TPA: outer membrane lipoprotein carrier protein LolA [Hyphomicrobiaceae bacterium]|nr:outer membrane lipoprotein carrier protein LolA [Hyphomicrobiaceae bacterium]
MRGSKRLAQGAAFALALMATAAVAQDTKKGAPPGSPVGGTWSAPKVVPDAPTGGRTFEPKEIEAIKRVSEYFNALTTLKGRFVQSVADKEKRPMRGRFYLQRPGRMRFEYGAPSKQLVVADGKMLAIQDLDLETDDQIALDQTAFRMLLRPDVDLIRDARILDLQEADDVIILTLVDKNPDAAGKIKLFLVKKPGLELKEWVTVDAQGIETRVEVGELAFDPQLVKGETIEPKLFVIEPISLKKKTGQ